MILLRHAILFYICLYVWVLVYLCLIYVIYFFIIIIMFIKVNYIISLRQISVSFGHVCLKFSLRVLLSFCLIFCHFQPGTAYKMLLKKKCVSSNCNWKKRTLCLHLTFKTAKNLYPNLQKPPLPSKIPDYAPDLWVFFSSSFFFFILLSFSTFITIIYSLIFKSNSGIQRH